ncbi:MAG: peptidase E [Clostridia bacterium]|nr:peptidase E [Clostridia bacterium]
MDKIIVAIGGGEIRKRETLEIDRYIAGLAKAHAGEKRATALFFPTASHDSKPYFNSFRKTYTSVFDIKADVALLTRNEMSIEKIYEKISICDLIYVGGGDTKHMLELWKATGVDRMIIAAYERGVPIAGLSAGAICWFNTMYTDYYIIRGESNDYTIIEGLGIIEGFVSPHYEERVEFDKVVLANNTPAIGLESNSAIVIRNGKIDGALTSGGKAYHLIPDKGVLIKEQIKPQ